MERDRCRIGYRMEWRGTGLHLNTVSSSFQALSLPIPGSELLAEVKNLAKPTVIKLTPISYWTNIVWLSSWPLFLQPSMVTCLVTNPWWPCALGIMYRGISLGWAMRWTSTRLSSMDRPWPSEATELMWPACSQPLLSQLKWFLITLGNGCWAARFMSIFKVRSCGKWDSGHSGLRRHPCPLQPPGTRTSHVTFPWNMDNTITSYEAALKKFWIRLIF